MSLHANWFIKRNLPNLVDTSILKFISRVGSRVPNNTKKHLNGSNAEKVGGGQLYIDQHKKNSYIKINKGLFCILKEIGSKKKIALKITLTNIFLNEGGFF